MLGKQDNCQVAVSVSVLLEAGRDLRWVQAQLGHASIAQTADTYGHVQPDRHAGAVNVLDQYIT